MGGVPIEGVLHGIEICLGQRLQIEFVISKIVESNTRLSKLRGMTLVTLSNELGPGECSNIRIQDC